MKTIKASVLFLIVLICLSMLCSTAFKIEEKGNGISRPSLAELYKTRKQKIISRWQSEHLLSKRNKQLKSANLQLLQNIFNNGNTTIPQKDLKGNMLIIGRYALLPQNTDDVPTLKKVNLDSMAIETIKYPELKQWSSYVPLTISDLQNGDIAYGVGPYILILYQNTLKLKQTLQLTRFN